MTTPRPDPDFVEAELAGGSVLRRLVRGWDRFFFKPADPTTLGLIRIFCGLIAVYTLAAFSLDLQEFFGKRAWVDLDARNEYRTEVPVYKMAWDWKGPQPPAGRLDPRKDEEYKQKWDVDPAQFVYQQGTPVWSIWFHVTEPRAMMAVHAAIILIAFLFTIGFCTRITSALTWFGFLCYIHRSTTTVFGVDTMMTIALLYLMIGPSGAALSVDRLIKRWWVARRALRRARLREGAAGAADGPVRIPPLAVQPLVSANLAIRLLQIHTCIIYFAAGLSKLQGRTWWTGEALWGTLANYEFAPMQYGFYTDFLVFLSNHRLFWEVFMTCGTAFTLSFEIGFVFLVWNRYTRWVYLGMAVTLHGGIGLFMGLKTFSMMMLTMVLSFVPPEVVRRWLRSVAWGPTGLRLYVPLHVRRAVRAASVIHALDAWNQVVLVARSVARGNAGGPAKEGLRLVDAEGQTWTGAAVYWRLFLSLGFFRCWAPWRWVIALFVRRPAREFVEESPVLLQEAVPEPVGLRTSSEVLKTNAPHVKQVRQKH